MTLVESSIGKWLIGSTLPVLVAAVVQPVEAAPPAGEQNGTFEFRPGVIVDAGAGVSYLMNTEDGIDALDLRSGTAVWTTRLAQKPLLLLGNTLVAQAEVEDRPNLLRLVFLDTESNGALEMQVNIDLPDGVRAAIDDGAGTTFRVEACEMNGGVAIAWAYSEAAVHGAEDSSKFRPQVRRLEGSAWVDLDTGAVSSPAAPDECVRAPDTPLPAKLARLKESGRLPSPLWRSGDTYAGAVRVRQGEEEHTVLRRWRAASGDSLPDVTLFAGDYTIRYASADGRHLLATRLDRTPSGPHDYDWLIFSLGTGERVAELRLSFPAAWFFVAGPLLVHEVQRQRRLENGVWTEEPRRLRAIDLQTGTQGWEWPLRDTMFRGSLPPAVPRQRGSEKPSGSSDALRPAEGEQTP